MITLSYYPGCSLKSSNAFYERSLQKVLSHYDIALKELDDWSCCGAAAAGSISEDLAHLLGARNIAIAEKEGLHILAPCSACYARTKTAAAVLARDRDARERINNELDGLSSSGSVEVRTIIEIFLEYVGVERIAGSVVYDTGAMRAVPYYGCLLTRNMSAPCPDDVEDPIGMDILLRALGVKVMPWQFKTECCGAGSTITDRDRTAQLSGRLMDMARLAGANVIVATCPLCHMNLDLVTHLVGKAAALPVLYLTEVFEAALFGAAEGSRNHIAPITGLASMISKRRTS